MKVNLGKVTMMAAAVALSAPLAVAQDATSTTATSKPNYTVSQRKENQQQRIGQGVENGSLTASEAARLEHRETKLNGEQRAMKADGTLTPAERAKLQHQENKLSRNIYAQKHDTQNQNLDPKSEVGKRQLEQQQRIGQGIQSGSLNSREATRLETRQAGVNKEVAGMRQVNGGKLTPQERRVVNRQENRNSRAIYRQKHDPQHR